PECLCATITGGPHQEVNAIGEATILALNSAAKRIWIMTPYFIPDGLLIGILRIANYKGVDIKIIVPAKNNKVFVKRASRAYYPLLLQAGVKIYEYDGMVHAKVGIIDDNLIYIGSANIDQRSFRLNFELSSFIESEKLNEKFVSVFESVFKQCTEIKPANYKKLPWHTRVIDAFFHLFSPLL
ncbi:MAG: phospholipase D-like domain-containing protein, partial [Fibrobacter sp.]|nr:phospholipase D-like domain-containing protein [Fibrobacter sp.]